MRHSPPEHSEDTQFRVARPVGLFLDALGFYPQPITPVGHVNPTGRLCTHQFFFAGYSKKKLAPCITAYGDMTDYGRDQSGIEP